MIAHKIVDALLKRNSKYTLQRFPGLTSELCGMAASRIDRADKFDFGQLPLEQAARSSFGGLGEAPELAADDELGAWKLPALTEDEFNFWRDGLLPLPAPICWYEFSIGDSPSGLCIWLDEQDHWCVERSDLLIDNRVDFDGIINIVTPSQCEYTKDGGLYQLKVGGNPISYNLLSKHKGWEQYNMQASVPLSMYLNLMLNSKTTELSGLIKGPPKLIAKQIKRGHTPLPNHRVVRIVPSHFIVQSEGEKRAHAPPRLHWRRSHLRHFDHQTGNAKYLPSLMHNGTQGWWVTAIPRFLVGRADLGEVSHEYRVITKETK